MEFLVVGLNHRTAPLEVREKLSITKARMPDALEAMSAYVDQGVILSTCNRSEVYTIGPEKHLGENVEGFFSDYFDIPPADIDSYLYTYHHEDSIHHLFRVSSSLDSMILGEGQILRQVRDAFEGASQAKMVQGSLSHLFHQAIRVGKKVRRETAISRNALSVSRACVELARLLLGDLRELKVMVIGAGDAGKLAARALRDAGVGEMVVTNRTYQRAAELARDLDGEAAPFEDMPRVLQDTDIAISSTGSPEYVLEGEAVSRAMSYRPHRPLFLIDIAVPRDIGPEVSRIDNVYLYNIDDLESISEANRLQREQEAQKAEVIVAHEVKQFLHWYDTLDVVPTVKALRQQAEEIRERELAKLLGRMDHQLTEKELWSLEAMSRAIVKKLLHEPTAYLKDRPSPDKVRLARELFSLTDDTASPEAPASEPVSEVPSLFDGGRLGWG